MMYMIKKQQSDSNATKMTYAKLIQLDNQNN